MEYSKEKVKKAGNILIDKNSSSENREWAKQVIEDLRIHHIDIVHKLRMLLGRKIKKYKGENSVYISQRIKTYKSIVRKLKIQKNMSLARMFDIGGIRIVCEKINDVYNLRYDIRNSENKSKFTCLYKIEKDFIKNPDDSGYRGIHLVYRDYTNTKFVEIQIRTRIQHLWATAVETFGYCVNQPLKQGKGQKKYLSALCYISEAFSYIDREKTNIRVFRKALNEFEKSGLKEISESVRGVADLVDKDRTFKNKNSYFILILDVNKKTIDIRSYSKKAYQEANKDYTKLESGLKEYENIHVVLVSTDNLKSLKRLYPNFYLDLSEFLSYVDELHKEIKKYNIRIIIIFALFLVVSFFFLFYIF